MGRPISVNLYMNCRTQFFVGFLCLACVLPMNSQINHLGLQFTRMTSEFPDFITIDMFDADHDWQAFFAEPVQSVEVVYSRSINEKYSYHVQLGYSSFVYGLSTSESFLLLSEIERQYQSRYLSPGSSLHYHLPKPFDDFHFSAGLITNILLRSRILTWRLQENGSLEVDETANDNINDLVIIPRAGIHYSAGNETIRITLSAYMNTKLNNYYATLANQPERFVSSFSISGNLNLNRFMRNRRLAEQQ